MSQIPATMRALFAASGPRDAGPEALELRQVPVPELQAGEVLIRVSAAGLNRPDIMQRQGRYPPPPGASAILGLECSGEIVRVGRGTARFAVGDKVVALVAGGAQAEYCVAPEGNCLPLPAGMDDTHGAVLLESLTTVWANLFEAGQLQAGEAALIHGGASGIGTYAIQLAKAFGATPIVTVGSEAKVAACRALGAQAINYTTQDFVAEVQALTSGKGVQVVLDMIGGAYVPRNLACLASGGRHVSIATQQGAQVEIDLRQVMQRRLVLTGSTLRARPNREKDRLLAMLEGQVWPLLAAGTVKPQLFQVFTVEKAAAAHKLMESSAHIGKIALAF